MVQLFLGCPRMNLLSLTLATWKVERHSVLRTKAVNGYKMSASAHRQSGYLNSADPTRTSVAPSWIAISKSPLMPIERSFIWTFVGKPVVAI